MSFQLLVKTLNGRTYVLDVASTDTVLSLKQRVEDADGTPAKEQRLTFGGKQLENDRVLSDYALSEGYVVHVMLRLKGGRAAASSDGRVI